MKRNALYKIITSSVVLLTIVSFATNTFAMSLYSRKSSKNNDSAAAIESVIISLFGKTNKGDVNKSEVKVQPSTTDNTDSSGNTINKFSQDEINGIVNEIKSNKSTDKVNLIDIITFAYRIMKAYGNVNTGAQTISKSKQLAVLTSVNSATKDTGPISVTPVKVNNEEYTMITLGGTEFLEGQATGIKEDLLCGTEQINDYLVDVVNTFSLKDSNSNPVIPKDKPIILTGISLGGMIAQQLLSQESIVKNYNIKYVMCFGSPIIAPTARKDSTTIVRFCDKNDIVPFLGATYILDEIKQKTTNCNPSDVITQLDNKEKKLENGGYKTFIGAHALSYVDNKCWNEYDVLGVKGGHNTITLEAPMKFYDAPTLSAKK